MAKQIGYNFLFEKDGKTFAGVQSDALSISSKVKESITKASQGNSDSVITGHEVTFSIGGLVEKKSGVDATILDNDDIIVLALAKGSAAIIPFVYKRGELKSYTGNAVITGYSENSDSENEANYSLNLKVQGDMIPVAPEA